jgi:hypothetical protein
MRIAGSPKLSLSGVVIGFLWLSGGMCGSATAAALRIEGQVEVG